MKTRVFIFIFFLISHFFAFAQDQECIMYFNDGTSIEGFGLIKKDRIQFRLTKEEKGDFWDYDDVSSIKFLGFEMSKTFKYVKLKKYESPKLLELLVDGEVSLYKEDTVINQYGYGGNPVATLPTKIGETEYNKNYLKRETEEIATCIDCSILKSWAKNVSNYLADCDTLVRDLKNHKYSFAELENAIIYYNDICVE